MAKTHGGIQVDSQCIPPWVFRVFPQIAHAFPQRLYGGFGGPQVFHRRAFGGLGGAVVAKLPRGWKAISPEVKGQFGKLPREWGAIQEIALRWGGNSVQYASAW